MVVAVEEAQRQESRVSSRVLERVCCWNTLGVRSGDWQSTVSVGCVVACGAPLRFRQRQR